MGNKRLKSIIRSVFYYELDRHDYQEIEEMIQDAGITSEELDAIGFNKTDFPRIYDAAIINDPEPPEANEIQIGDKFAIRLSELRNYEIEMGCGLTHSKLLFDVVSGTGYNIFNEDLKLAAGEGDTVEIVGIDKNTKPVTVTLHAIENYGDVDFKLTIGEFAISADPLKHEKKITQTIER